MEHVIGLISFFFEVLPSSFRIEGLRYVFGAGGIFVLTWVLLAGVLKNRRIRKAMPRKLLHKQIKREVRNSVIAILVFTASFAVVHYSLSQFMEGPVFKFYFDVSDYTIGWDAGWAYFVFSIILWTVGLDTYFYWTHRFMHLKRFYRVFHLEHHRSHNPTPFTAYSFAPSEAVLVYLYTAIFYFFIPMHVTAVLIAMVIQMVRNALAHCGYEVFPRGWTRHPILGIFTTVTHHDLHHEKGGYNFGFYFTFWDKVMGTEHPEYHQRFDRAVGQKSADKPHSEAEPIKA